MSFQKTDDWPEIGELVISTVYSLTKQGGYVRLDEYNKEGFLHISEISSSWVKNLRDFIREGEKVVLKVLRVDPYKQHIDLSLRRVTKPERRTKLLLWKRTKKVDGLFKTVARRLNTDEKEIFNKIGIPLEKDFGDIYSGLEKTAREGIEVLLELGISEKLAKEIYEISKDKIKISLAKSKRILNIKCNAPDGVVKIKEALMEAKKIKKPRGTKIKIYSIAPPKYMFEVFAGNYKKANILLEKASEKAVELITKIGGEGYLEEG